MNIRSLLSVLLRLHPRRAPLSRTVRIPVRRWLVLGAAALLAAPASRAYDFSLSALQNNSVKSPTSLQFGSDDRLYVLEKSGIVKILTVERVSANNYQVTATEQVNLVRDIPNYHDDGTLNSGLIGRQATGLLVVGTASNPVIYVTSTDPLQGGGSGGDNDLNLDTNSGIISRLTKSSGSWSKVDLVRGLPRSEENHAPNGLQFDQVNNRLLVAAGGNTNAGGPSTNMAYLGEAALSAAILSVDLAALDAMPVKTDAQGQKYLYNLPTLDDPNPARAHNADGSDVNDPFGGNDGLNQAKLVPGGPVQIFASGFRNPYDLVITKTAGRENRIYAFDNGANQGWGGYPHNEGSDGTVTNQYVDGEPGELNNKDGLHYITGAGYYAGHPNPIRANPAGAGWFWFDNGAAEGLQKNYSLNPTSDWPPVPTDLADPRQGDFRMPGPESGALLVNSASTNGITEYVATNFDGELQGNLVAADFTGKLLRIELSADGTQVLNGVEFMAANFGNVPLDVTAPQPGAGGPFTGTIWVCHFTTSGLISVFEPADFDSPGSNDCTGVHDYTIDEDGDGYSNGDELDNDSDPCNGSVRPPDYDGDGVSDLNDPDDDGDGIPDVDDVAPLDALNGAGNTIPVTLDLFNTGEGFFNVDLTGLMVNPGEDYLSRYYPDDIIAGGTAGLFTIPFVGSGTALGSANSQDNAFLFVVPSDSSTGKYVVRCRISGPFFEGDPQGSQSHGFFIGSGDQDNYIKIALHANNGAGAIEVVQENEGDLLTHTLHSVSGALSSNVIDLYLVVDPALGTVQPQVLVEGASNRVTLGPVLLLEGETLAAVAGLRPLAIGLIATTGGSGTPTFGATWDLFELAVVPSTASAQVTIDSESGSILSSSTYTSNSFKLYNTSTSGQKISRAIIDLGTALLPDVVFDPDGTAGDTASKGFTLDTNSGVSSVDGAFTAPHNGSDGNDGYDQLTIDFTGFDPGDFIYFSADIDPTSIKGVEDPGPNWAGSISGLELTGSTITFLFDDGTVQRTRPSRVGGSSTGSEATATTSKPPAPHLSIVGATSPYATAGDPTLEISGPAGASVILYSFESGLYTEGVEGGGYDIDPFESNVVLSVNQQSLTLPEGGTTTVPVTLLHTSEESGYNLFTAVITEDGIKSPTSEVLTIKHDPSAGDGEPPTQPQNLTASGVSSTGLTLEWSASTDNEEVTGYRISRNGTPLTTVTGLSFTDSGLSPSTSYSYAVEATDAAGNLSEPATLTVTTTSDGGGAQTAVLRVNAGGSSYVDTAGNTWDADIGFNTGLTSSSTNEIAGTQDDPLYRTDRYDPQSGADLVYSFPLADGEYLVKLHFAETYSGAMSVGARIFDVSTEGTLALDNFDIFAEVGGNTALVKSISATVNDGQLDIAFARVEQNPKINAIEVFAVDSSGENDTEPPTAPTNLAASNVTDTSLTLTWDASTDNVGVTGYRVSRDGTVLDTVTSTSFDDSGLTAGTSYNYAVEALDAAGNASAPATLTVTTASSGGGGGETAVLRINAGGSSYVDTAGNTWDADHGFNTGLTATSGNAISGTEDDPLYQTERYDSPSGASLVYSFTLAAGDYAVNLHFAETYSGAMSVGGRVFDVSIEGTLVLDNFDIFAEVGGNTALVKSISTTVADGQLDIAFSHVAQNPKINAIEVFAIDSEPPTAPTNLAASNVTETSLTLTWDASSDNVGVTGYRVSRDGTMLDTVTSTSYNDSGLTAGTTYDYTVVALDAAGNTSTPATLSVTTGGGETAILRVNAGGSSYLDEAGNTWEADTGFNTGLTATSSNAIAGTADDPLYQSERYDRPSNPDLIYSFTVPNGGYFVRLHFAETYSGAMSIGARVFDVSIEGTLALDNFDIFAEVGGNTALIKSIPVTIADGQLNIAFAHVAQNPKINAIEVLLVETGEEDTEPPSAPSNLAASNVTETSLTLTWDASTDNVQVTGYRVSRDGTVMDTVITTSFDDSGLTAGTSYNYSVVALDAAGNTSTPATLSVTTTTSDDSEPPTPPSNLAAANVSDTSLTLTWSASTDNVEVTGYRISRDGTVLDTVTMTSFDDSGLTAETSYEYTVVALDAAGNTSAPAALSVTTTATSGSGGDSAVLRVNAGGSSYLDGDGNTWEADTGFNTGLTATSSNAIADTADDPLYQSERYDRPSNPDLIYSFALPNGDYLVRLHFAETYSGAMSIGARVFDVSIEGALALDNFDIFAQVGGNTALVASIPSTITDGQLDIAFSHGAGNPKINAIEVILIDAASDDTEPPTAPSNLAASNVTETSLTLTWDASTDNVGVTGYRVSRDGTVLDTVTTTSFDDSGLTAGTTYDYTVLAVDAAGNTSTPAVLSVTTTDDAEPPSAPSNLAAANVTDTSLTLTWDASTDNVEVTGYRISRDGTILDTVTMTSFDDSGLTAETSYEYTVVALDAAGNASAPAALSVTTASASGGGGNAVVLRVNTGGSSYLDGDGNTWEADTGFNTGLTATSSNAIAGTAEDSLYQSERYDRPSSPDLIYSFALPNGDYLVRLHFAETYSGAMSIGARVFDVSIEGALALDNFDIFAQAGGNTALVASIPSTITDGQLDIAFAHVEQNPKINAIEVLLTGDGDTEPPTAPTNLAASNVTNTSLTLTWDASTDNVGVTGYRVSRDGTVLDTVTTTSFDDTGLAAGTSYDYSVVALDAAGNASAPATLTVTTTSSTDTEPPTAPTNLAASNVTNTSLTLTWDASTDNIGVTGYRVSRDGTVLDTVTSTSFDDSGLTAGTSYNYAVEALDAAGNASPPATLTVTTSTASGGGETTVLRVNAGGSSYLDTAGNTWDADHGFNAGLTATSSNEIAGTEDDPLYQTERYDPPSGASLVYSFTLPDGDYTVNLHFAETYSSAMAVGGRVFDVTIEGTLALDNFDIFSEVGGNTALVKSIPVTIADGQLDVAFAHVTQNPKINAIEVTSP